MATVVLKLLAGQNRDGQTDKAATLFFPLREA